MVRIAIAFVAVFFVLGDPNALCASTMPPSWYLTGSHPEFVSVDVSGGAMHLTGSAPTAEDFGSAIQEISAAHYDGKKVRFAADVRSEGLSAWTGLWMRVDSASGDVLAFDNMQSRPITGTTQWRRYSIVLPVATSAKDIAFGILLCGSGNAWMKNLSFETVNDDVKPTSEQTLPLEPNLTL